MPMNAASGAWCTISLLPPETSPPPTTSTAIVPPPSPCEEYKHETKLNPNNGALQEVATIESQPASPFEIVLNLDSTAYSTVTQNPADPASYDIIPHDHLVLYYLDGIAVGLYKQSRSLQHRTIRCSKIYCDGYTSFKRLQFANINLVDPDDYPSDRICEDEQVIKSLGTIRIDVHRCFLAYEPYNPPYTSTRGVATTNQMNFSERTKKACLSTTAGLSNDLASDKPPPTYDWVVKSQDPNPFLQFIFNYKPRPILENEGIIVAPLVQVKQAPSEPEPKAQDKNSQNKRVKEEEKEKNSKKSSGTIDLEGHQDKKPKLIELEKKPHDQKPPPMMIDLTGPQKPHTNTPNFIDLTGDDSD